MDRLSPVIEADPVPPPAPGSRVLRGTMYTLLIGMLAAGGWLRFHDQIGGWLNGAPLAATRQSAAENTPAKGLVEAAMVPPAGAAAAIAAMQLSGPDAKALARDVARRRIALVQMPLFDAGPALNSGATRAVLVRSAGYSRLVPLTRTPAVVTLPIDRVGTVLFSVPDALAGRVGVGAITISGPVELPPLNPGQMISVEVVAQ